MNQVNEFINSICSNETIRELDNGFKYPYKPALIISIIDNVKSVDQLFNNPIDLSYTSPIIETYYKIIMSSPTVFEYFKTNKRKNRWFTEGLTDSVRKDVLTNIKESPARNLKPLDVWQYDKPNNKLVIALKGSREELEMAKHKILIAAQKRLVECIPDYEGIDASLFVDMDEYIKKLKKEVAIRKVITEREVRLFQHDFRKCLLQRDKKCLLCNLDIPQVLEAAHIKDHAICKTIEDKWDLHNGIILCRNHHKMFDAGLLTFDDHWKIHFDGFYEQIIKNTIASDYINNFKGYDDDKFFEFLDFHNKKVDFFDK